MMKINKTILLSGFLLLSLVSSLYVKADDKIYPDDNFHWDYNWGNSDNKFMSFYNHNGVLMAFRLNDHGDLKIFEYDQLSKAFSMTFEKEDVACSFREPLAFTFQDRIYTYVIDIEDEIYAPGQSYAYYKGRFFYAGEDMSTWDNYEVVTDKEGVTQVKDYTAACVADSLVYLFYSKSYDLNSLTNNIYSYHKPHVDICYLNEETDTLEILYTRSFASELPTSHIFAVTSALCYPDADSNMRILATCDASYLNDNTDYGGFLVDIDPDSWEWEQLCKEENAYNMELVAGSMKGQMSEASGSGDLKTNPTRFQVLYSYFTEGGFWHNDNGEFYYRTYALTNTGLEECTHGKIHQANTTDNPENWHQNQISVTYGLTFDDVDQSVSGVDAYQQKIWLFHQDKNDKIVANKFDSDIWMPVPGTTIHSDNLDDVDQFGPGVRDLWTLIGITDGAPPCSIDWDVWDANHSSIQDPTQLVFSDEQSTECSISYTSKDVFKASLEASVPNFLGFSLKYSEAFEHSDQSTKTNKQELEQTINLTEEGQDQGRYLWLVPQIQRTEYATFPWWDTNFDTPVHLTTQYRFITNGQSLEVIPEPLSNSIFGISNPNDPTMNSWRSENRSVDDYASELGFQAYPVNWNGLDEGQIKSFEEVESLSSSYSTTTSYKLELSAGIKIPDVFEYKETAGGDFEYTNENETKTDEQKSITVKLNMLVSPDDGPQISKLHINAYIFRPGEVPDSTFWYVDTLQQYYTNKQSPWYVAYVVTSASAVQLDFPPEGYLLSDEKALFSWTDTQRNSLENTLYIGEQAHISPGSLVYKSRITDNSCQHIFDKDRLEPGKTYYWCVSTKTIDNQIVWTESRSFRVPELIQQAEEGFADQIAHFNFDVYPNPTLNNQQFFVRYNSEESSHIQMQIFNLTGDMLMSENYYSSEGENTMITVDKARLNPGIYFIRVSGSGKTGTHKLVVK